MLLYEKKAESRIVKKKTKTQTPDILLYVIICICFPQLSYKYVVLIREDADLWIIFFLIFFPYTGLCFWKNTVFHGISFYTSVYTYMYIYVYVYIYMHIYIHICIKWVPVLFFWTAWLWMGLISLCFILRSHEDFCQIWN